jgi:hypothetical protein
MITKVNLIREIAGPLDSDLESEMHPLTIFEELSPHLRVATAVLPFAVSILLRLLFGKNRLFDLLISVATAWFAINVFLAPYSARMQEDLRHLRAVLP